VIGRHTPGVEAELLPVLYCGFGGALAVDFSRRDLSLFLPALAAEAGAAQTTALPSRTFRYEDLPVRANGPNRARAILNGETHRGYPLEVHMTELGAGQMPHPPHHHVHEEMILIHEGTLEVTIAGQSIKLGPGSAAYVASNEEHGWRNVGTERARYWVIAIGGDQV
jgi:mannose-6-phosphate isomerase-like protein (cupin superfamily)